MMGDGKRLSEEFGRTISGYAPLFRAILTLVGPERPPSGLADVLARLETATGISTRPYRQALEIKQSGNKPGISELNSLFEDYYRTTEELSRLIDEHQG